jgi:hypothetical protein
MFWKERTKEDDYGRSNVIEGASQMRTTPQGSNVCRRINTKENDPGGVECEYLETKQAARDLMIFACRYSNIIISKTNAYLEDCKFLFACSASFALL